MEEFPDLPVKEIAIKEAALDLYLFLSNEICSSLQKDLEKKLFNFFSLDLHSVIIEGPRRNPC